jgi:HNH endonuclease
MPSLYIQRRKPIDRVLKGKNGKKYKLWKGNKCDTKIGYVVVRCPSHPYAFENGYVYEHRLVMEIHLGRILLPTEVVHHINGLRDDNRIENLMLFSTHEDHKRYHYPKGSMLGKNKGLAA